MMRMIRALLVLAGLGVWGIATIHGQTVTTPGIDILFLVDQSGSMGGATFDGPANLTANDPLALRFEAVQYAFTTLEDYRTTIAPNTQMRMAVVNFGDTVELALDWTLIAEGSGWATQRNNLIAQLTTDTFRDTHPDAANLGNTDFMTAFRFADTVFQELPNTGYQRALVVLTDGQPCVPDRFACGDENAQQQEMNDLLSLVNQVMPATNYQMYVLAIDDSGELWSTREQDWKAITRDDEHAIQVVNSFEIGSSFQQILRNLLNISEGDSLPPGEPRQIAVPPYTAQIRISIFKSSSDPALLTIRHPDGELLDSTNPQITVTNRDRPIEIWNIYEPTPGTWEFQVGNPNDELDAYLEFIPIQVQARMPDRAFLQYETAVFDIEFTDDTQQPLPIYESPYNLVVSITAIRPDGTQQLLTPTGQVQSVYTAELYLDQAGIYTIAVEATNRLPDGSLVTVYSYQEVGAIQTSDVVVSVESMPSGTYKASESATLEILTVNPNDNQPIDVTNLELLSSFVNTATGNAQPIPLQKTGVGRYEATLRFDTVGEFSLGVEAQFDGDGWQTIGESAISVVPSDLIQIIFVKPTPNTSIERSSGIPYITEKENSINIIVQTSLVSNGQPFDIFKVAADADNVLTLRIKDADGNDVQAGELEAIPNEVGSYQLKLDSLNSTGKWTLTASIQGDLNGSYVIDPVLNEARQTFTILDNPLLYPFWGIGGVGAILFGISLFIFMRQRVAIRKHPCVGDLQVVETSLQRGRTHENILLEISLDRYKRNTIRLGRRQLKGIPKNYSVRSILVTCSSDTLNRQRKVTVTIYGKKRGKILVNKRMLAPSSNITVPIDNIGIETRIELRKDHYDRVRHL